jgi:hypothetical protein
MNEVFQPLRFHTSTSYQLVKRHIELGFNNIVPLIASSSKLIPFQLYRQNISTYILASGDYISVYVVNYKTGAITDITSQITLTIGTQQRGFGIYDQFATYDGNTTFSTAFRQGIYYIHAVSKDGYHYYSDLFKIGVYDTVTIEYKNSYSFGNLWMNTYFTASYVGKSYDTSEFLEYSEINKNDDNFDIYTYQRSDKIRAVSFFADSNAIDMLKLAKMCDSIYLTDELGLRQTIEIVEISPVAQNKSNYTVIVMKYRVIDESLISVNKNTIQVQYSQIGTPGSVTPPVVTPVTGVLTFNGHDITFDGQTITP